MPTEKSDQQMKVIDEMSSIENKSVEPNWVEHLIMWLFLPTLKH